MSCHVTRIVVGYKEKDMKDYLMLAVDRVLDGDWYMNFHWLALIGLWAMCGYQLWHYEFGNVLCMSAVICAWKMKGVEE